jgi:hypothetical protein
MTANLSQRLPTMVDGMPLVGERRRSFAKRTKTEFQLLYRSATIALARQRADRPRSISAANGALGVSNQLGCVEGL